MMAKRLCGFFGRVGSTLLALLTLLEAAMHGAKIVGWRSLVRAFRFESVRGFMMYMLLLKLCRKCKVMLSGETLRDGRIVVAILTWSPDSCGWVYEIGLTLTKEGVITHG